MYHGSSRHRLSSILQDNDLILTTYETLRSDWEADGALYSTEWYRLVLDEGRRHNLYQRLLELVANWNVSTPYSKSVFSDIQSRLRNSFTTSLVFDRDTDTEFS